MNDHKRGSVRRKGESDGGGRGVVLKALKCVSRRSACASGSARQLKCIEKQDKLPCGEETNPLLCVLYNIYSCLPNEIRNLNSIKIALKIVCVCVSVYEISLTSLLYSRSLKVLHCVNGFISLRKVMVLLYFLLIIIRHPSLSSISDAPPCRRRDLYLHYQIRFLLFEFCF